MAEHGSSRPVSADSGGFGTASTRSASMGMDSGQSGTSLRERGGFEETHTGLSASLGHQESVGEGRTLGVDSGGFGTASTQSASMGMDSGQSGGDSRQAHDDEASHTEAEPEPDFSM